MKKLITSGSVLLSAFLFASALIFSGSCKKETDAKAVITVLSNATGAPVVGAIVRLDYQGGGLQSDQQVTDGSGKTSHTFKYPAVLDITVDASTQGYTVYTGLVKLEEGKTTDETVKLN